MDKRTLTLYLGVLLLLLPFLSTAAAINYGLRAHEQPNAQFILAEEIERENNVRSYSFSIDDSFEYVVFGAHLGYCCPQFGDGDAVKATINAPDGRVFTIRAEVGGECHLGDSRSCDYLDLEDPKGSNWIVVVQPPLGRYEVQVYPAGNLQEFGRYQGAGFSSVRAFEDFENHPSLRGNNIWWYYPNGSEEFVEDGGYFGWNDATPRIWVLGILSVTGWATGIGLLARARRLRIKKHQ